MAASYIRERQQARKSRNLECSEKKTQFQASMSGSWNA